MTVKELIETLECFDPESEVHFAYPSNDYWGTTLSRQVDSVECAKVEYSEYHRTNKIIDYDYEDADAKDVVILQ
jgi:hypothetical protein